MGLSFAGLLYSLGFTITVNTVRLYVNLNSNNALLELLHLFYFTMVCKSISSHQSKLQNNNVEVLNYFDLYM